MPNPLSQAQSAEDKRLERLRRDPMTFNVKAALHIVHRIERRLKDAKGYLERDTGMDDIFTANGAVSDMELDLDQLRTFVVAAQASGKMR